jgi:hypothetical protein
LSPSTDDERLRSAFTLLVDVDAVNRPPDTGPKSSPTEPPDGSDARTLEKFDTQIRRVVEIAQHKIGALRGDPGAGSAQVLWVLIDVLRDGVWLPESVMEGLRFPLLTRLGLPAPSPQPQAPEEEPTGVDAATMVSVQRRAGDFIRGLDGRISHLDGLESAVNFLADAILGISRDHVGGGHAQRRDPTIEMLRQKAMESIGGDDDAAGEARRYARTHLWQKIQLMASEMPLDTGKTLYHFAAVLPGAGWLTPDQVRGYYEAVRRPLTESGIAAQTLEEPIWAWEPPPTRLGVEAVRQDILPQLADFEQAFQEPAGRRATLRDVSDQLAVRIRKVAICLGDFGPNENKMIDDLVEAVNRYIRGWEEIRDRARNVDAGPPHHLDHIALLKSQLSDAAEESRGDKQRLEQAQQDLVDLKKALEDGLAEVTDGVRRTPPQGDFMAPVLNWFTDILPRAVTNLDTGPVVAAIEQHRARMPGELAEALKALVERTKNITRKLPQSPAEAVRLIAGLNQYPFSQLGGDPPEVSDFTKAAANLVNPDRQQRRRMGWS